MSDARRRHAAVRWTFVLLVLSGAACRQPAAPEAQPSPGSAPARQPSQGSSQQPPHTPGAATVEESKAEQTEPAQRSGTERKTTIFDALGLRRGRPIPEGLELGGDCPAVGADADEEIAAQAAARVPLKPGLTLTRLWKPTPAEEYECLLQVKTVDRDGIVLTQGCTNPRTPGHKVRRTCRSDLRGARMLHTAAGMTTVIDASGEERPETVVGATEFSLAVAAFAELKRTGTTRHHYVQFGSMDSLEWEATAVLQRAGAEIARVTVNDGTIEVPVIRATGEASLWMHGRAAKGRVTALILDDDRFPLLIDYAHSSESSEQPVFRLHFLKVSFPSTSSEAEEARGRRGAMELRLTEHKPVDVYGIYFDFNSDRIRLESDPILNEIAEMLRRNAGWNLSINGHTDNIGGDSYNRDLSRRRSEAVRKALVDRYGIAAGRLLTAGHGASAPKESNDTPEGRARNRRVELVRR